MTFPGGIRQVGHLVPDLDVAVQAWRAIGVGPWFLVDSPLEDAVYDGQSASPTLRIGFANVGELQIELIEVVGDEPSIWQAYRDSGRFGPHHVAYWAEDFAAAIQAGHDRGLAVAQQFGAVPAIYFHDPAAALLVEVMEHGEIAKAFMTHIHDASLAWDGAQAPIRLETP